VGKDQSNPLHTFLLPPLANRVGPDDAVGAGGQPHPNVRSRTRQVEEHIKAGIREGRLHVGARLPSTRELARELQCSRWVVVQAYEQLVAEGFLVAKVGSGTVVAPQPGQPDSAQHPLESRPTATYDFHPGLPDLSKFPREAWLRAMRRAMSAVTVPMLDYPDPAGSPELRTALASYLGRARAVVTSPAQVMISAGTNHALGIIGRALAQQGLQSVAVENPGWIPFRNPLTYSGLTVVPVPVDQHGVQVENIPPGVRAILVTPAHQFPSGALMSPERRSALIDWARATDGVIIEDDYDAEFRYDRRPIGTLQGLAPDHVIYTGSLSKVLVPCLRLGWFVVPKRWHAAVVEARQGIDSGVSLLEQVTVSHLIESTVFERHLRLMRREYRARRATLLAALSHYLPTARVDGIPAGLHANVDVDVDLDEDALRHRFVERGVRISLLSDFCDGGRVPASMAGRTRLVMGFGAVSTRRIAAGIAVIADALGQARS
jgi:GntR family transcriptional regulator/MocR family aminotransferase